MRRIGSFLKFLGRGILLIVGIAVIVLLANSAVSGARDLAARADAHRLHDEQRTVFPGTATAISFLRSTLIYDKTHAPTPTITPTESDNADTSDNGSQDGETMPVEQAALTPTVMPTVTPGVTLSPTGTPTILPTPTLTLTVPPSPTAAALEVTLPAPKTLAQAAMADTLQPTLPPTNTKRPSPTAVLNTHTPTATSTVPPTLTPIPTSTPTATYTSTATPSATSTVTPTTALPATPTPPASPQATSKLPTVLLPGERTERPQPTAIPTHAPRVRSNGMDIMNVLLIGTDSDVDPSDPSFRTDSMVIVSINRTANTVAMLSIPRDLFVYIPSLGMQRINTAFQWGQAVNWSPGGGFGLLQQTILYNLGIPVHYYARVSFDGFKQIVDTLNGIDVAVDCAISDLRFQGQYNDQKTPVYSPFTLDVGYYHMNGSLALWYARMREQTSDFDRNRRQQQVLRAIWRTARDQGLITKAPELWGQLTGVVDTNLKLPDVLGLIPIALNLKPADIANYYMVKGKETMHWRTPSGDDVQLPDPQSFFKTINDFYTPPTTNRLGREVGVIEVVNGSPYKDWDKVAADRLAWEGFDAQAKGAGDPTAKTVIYDYTGSAKPGALAIMTKALNVRPDQVVRQPDPNRTADFRVVLGADYNSCSAPGFAK